MKPFCRPWASRSIIRRLSVTIIAANAERSRAASRSIWKLITDLPVRTRAAAIEKIDWYAMRWKIKVFHKILDPGCKAENQNPRR